jgi:hypothetical protein
MKYYIIVIAKNIPGFLNLGVWSFLAECSGVSVPLKNALKDCVGDVIKLSVSSLSLRTNRVAWLAIFFSNKFYTNINRVIYYYHQIYYFTGNWISGFCKKCKQQGWPGYLGRCLLISAGCFLADFQLFNL